MDGALTLPASLADLSVSLSIVMGEEKKEGGYAYSKTSQHY